MFIKYCVFLPRILESLPPLPRQHSVAIGCSKNYQPKGVTMYTRIAVRALKVSYSDACEGGVLQWNVKKHNFSWTPCICLKYIFKTPNEGILRWPLEQRWQLVEPLEPQQQQHAPPRCLRRPQAPPGQQEEHRAQLGQLVQHLHHQQNQERNQVRVCLCVYKCVCVCVRKREGEKDR